MPGWKLVIASDGSPSALRAADWIAQHFDPASTTVTVVTVEHLAMPLIADPAPLRALDEIVQEALTASREAADTALDQTAKHLAGFSPRTVRLMGPPVEALVRYLDQERPDLVVMGRRGLGVVGSVLGSVSLGVMQRSPVPVLVVEPPRT
ncbi:MAG: universal stress protein [Firmicutes bacterium]|nr:universal stress protein [Alicyclobacillaceae bacterium]MCL6496571.1 universal stress protein [Bacillota bacterium]